MNKIILVFILSLTIKAQGLVVTTTQNVKYIVDQLLINTKSDIEVFAVTKGAQDPHFLTAKPSYTVKLSRADLLISIGFGLEEGWLPLVQRSARNPKIMDEESGHLVLGHFITNPIEVPDKLTRADGDVHAEGNPHFTQSPIRVISLVEVIATRLVKIYPNNANKIKENADAFIASLKNIVEKIKASKVDGVKLITYHKTLNYFFKDFNVDVVEYLEPKPGIPPSASHILKLIKIIEEQKIKLVLIENYYADEVSMKLKTRFPDLIIKRIAVEVGGDDKAKDLSSIYDSILAELIKAR